MLDPHLLPPDTTRPLRRSEYDKLVELGAFEDEKVELLYGAVVRMSPQGPPHDYVIERLTLLLVRQLSDRATIRIQSAFAAQDSSEPQPDAAVVPQDDYRARHPAQAWLIIEVALSSLKKDLGIKAKLYAECGVPEYWVINLTEDLIEVHTEIVGGRYARVTPYRKGELIRLQQFSDIAFAVQDVLP